MSAAQCSMTILTAIRPKAGREVMEEEKDIGSLIFELQKHDNPRGYKLEYKQIKGEFEPIINTLIERCDEALDSLHKLLEHEETWSCLFALETIREIKSEKSIPFLINFIVTNEEGYHDEGYEEAMRALIHIGKPAVETLLREVKSDFNDSIFSLYLVGALTGIKDERVYSFMVEVINDLMANPEKYDGWFKLEMFVYDFSEQENKEVLPLLRELLSKEWLNDSERMEIEDTILIIEDPEAFKRRNDELSKSLALLLKKSEPAKAKKIGRNEPCPCGSGKKYKKCCLNKQVPA